MRRALVLLVLALVACSHRADVCTRARKIIIDRTAGDPIVQKSIDLETASDDWRAMCRARFNEKTLACIAHTDDASTCPMREIRTPPEIPDADTCAQVAAHVRMLAAAADLDATGQGFWAHSAETTCSHSLTRAQVACELAAKDLRALAPCSRPR